jgi:uncharacterized protein DUF6318
VSRRRVAVLAAVAVSVSVLVAGCTQDAGPKPSPLPSTTKTASPSSTAPTPPVMPAEAKGTSAKSAKAFVRYWIATLNFAGRSGNTTSLRESSAQRCAACNAIADFIDKVYSAGGSISGDGWSVRTVRFVDSGPGRSMTIDALVDVKPQDVVKRKGAARQHFDGGRRLKTFSIAAEQDSWRVARLDQPE